MGAPPRLLLLPAALLCICRSAAAGPSVDVVLAHYSENLAWTEAYKKLTDVVFKVYSKGVAPPVGAVVLPNVGREAHTFLYHIVHQYHRLADWTVFSQAVQPSWGYHGGGEVSGHLSDTVEFSDYLRPFIHGHDSYFVLNAASQFPSARQTNRLGSMIKNLTKSAMSKSMCPPGGAGGWTPWWWDQGHPQLWGTASDITMLQFYHRFIARDDYSDEPLILTFAQGARFAVSRKRIHRRPREYYAALLEQLSHSVMPMEGYWMEAVWYDIFHPEALQSKRPPCTLPSLPPPQAALTIAEMEAETLRRTRERGLRGLSEAAPGRGLSSGAYFGGSYVSSTTLEVTTTDAMASTTPLASTLDSAARSSRAALAGAHLAVAAAVARALRA